MYKTLLSFCFAFLSVCAFSQSTYYYVTGMVLSADAKTPLQGASVFAENTTLGTVTDQDGKFVLALPNGGYSLVVSYTGFNTQSERVSNNNAAMPLSFALTTKEKLMGDVAIVSTGEVKNGWEKYGNFFLEEFIGKTKNSEQCSIRNPEVLKFFYSKRKGRLKVLAEQPIVIENNALGYTIKYELDSFVHEYNSELSVFTGYPLFEDMKDSTEAQKSSWKAAREKAYYGSTLHFMRSFYNKQLEKEGYELQLILQLNNKDEAFKIKDVYSNMGYATKDSSASVTIKPKQPRIGVLYKKDKPTPDYIKANLEEPTDFQFSTLIFPLEGNVEIESNGFYFDQNEITLSGYWSWLKMGDALPYDFMP